MFCTVRSLVDKFHYNFEWLRCKSPTERNVLKKTTIQQEQLSPQNCYNGSLTFSCLKSSIMLKCFTKRGRGGTVLESGKTGPEFSFPLRGPGAEEPPLTLRENIESGESKIPSSSRIVHTESTIWIPVTQPLSQTLGLLAPHNQKYHISSQQGKWKEREPKGQNCSHLPLRTLSHEEILNLPQLRWLEMMVKNV